MDNGDSRWCSVCRGRGKPGRGESREQTVGPSLRHSQAGHDDDDDNGDGDDDDGDHDHDDDVCNSLDHLIDH